MIKAIVFDFYGVVCSEIGSPWYSNIPSLEKRVFLHENFDKPSNLGHITEEEFFIKIGEAVGRTGPEVRSEWVDSAKINHDLVSWIRDKKTDFKIALCSNTQPVMLRELLRNNDIEQLFDVIVSSSEVGKMKPNRDIYELVLNELHLKADEVLFVDDREVNVNGAKAVGMNTLTYTDTPSSLADLDKLLFQSRP